MEGNGQAIFGQIVGLEARKLVKSKERRGESGQELAGGGQVSGYF